MQGPVHGNVLLRARQYELMQDPAFCLHISTMFITGKIHNSRVTLRRFVREYPDRHGTEQVEYAVMALKHRCSSVTKAPDIELLRGIEGEAANIYFKAFSHLILHPDPQFRFNNRVRRPPTDIVNAMLSMGYALLANECMAAFEGVGLDPAAGFMHTLRPGRYSLALDLMEEMRSYIVDRTVLALINTRQISPSDFQQHTKPADGMPMPVLFTDGGLKKFLTAWQNKKKTEIIHPFLGEKIKIGLLPHVQALLLARYLRGDLDDYPVFIAK